MLFSCHPAQCPPLLNHQCSPLILLDFVSWWLGVRKNSDPIERPGDKMPFCVNSAKDDGFKKSCQSHVPKMAKVYTPNP